VKRYLFRPKAATDVETARGWYERERQGLGDEFLDEVLTIRAATRTCGSATGE